MTMHWGQDIGAIIARFSGLLTTISVLVDRGLGIDGRASWRSSSAGRFPADRAPVKGGSAPD